MKKVLITGANGFTGGNLLETLNRSDVELIPLVHRSCGLENEVVADFCDPTFPQLLAELPDVDVTVHLGTRVGWDGSTRADLFQPNVLATAQLVDRAKRNDSYFIFASAALIAGTRNPEITLNSGLDLRTDNDYLYSKWLGEEVIRMSGVRHGILRISGIFGRNGPPHLGLNRAISNALEGIPPVRYGDGNIKRNYIYVKDLCEIIRQCIKDPVEGTHLVAGSEVNTLAQMLDTICRVMLPGKEPGIRTGGGGNHQVIQHSHRLPRGRSFEDAIKDIQFN